MRSENPLNMKGSCCLCKLSNAELLLLLMDILQTGGLISPASRKFSVWPLALVAVINKPVSTVALDLESMCVN